LPREAGELCPSMHKEFKFGEKYLLSKRFLLKETWEAIWLFSRERSELELLNILSGLGTE
jgi:hypothetical protein